MDDRTGVLYPSRKEALRAGVPPAHVVQLIGSRESVERVSSAVRHASKHARVKRRKAGRRQKVPGAR